MNKLGCHVRRIAVESCTSNSTYFMMILKVFQAFRFVSNGIKLWQALLVILEGWWGSDDSGPKPAEAERAKIRGTIPECPVSVPVWNEGSTTIGYSVAFGT